MHSHINLARVNLVPLSVKPWRWRCQMRTCKYWLPQFACTRETVNSCQVRKYDPMSYICSVYVVWDYHIRRWYCNLRCVMAPRQLLGFSVCVLMKFWSLVVPEVVSDENYFSSELDIPIRYNGQEEISVCRCRLSSTRISIVQIKNLRMTTVLSLS